MFECGWLILVWYGLFLLVVFMWSGFLCDGIYDGLCLFGLVFVVWFVLGFFDALVLCGLVGVLWFVCVCLVLV